MIEPCEYEVNKIGKKSDLDDAVCVLKSDKHVCQQGGEKDKVCECECWQRLVFASDEGLLFSNRADGDGTDVWGLVQEGKR